MPTELLRQLVAKGPQASLERLREDAAWHAQPWSLLYSAVFDKDGDVTGRLVVRYTEDFKRPGPSVRDLASRYRDLDLTLEYCDEFGTKAGRMRFVQGRQLKTIELGPYDLDWVDWERDDDA